MTYIIVLTTQPEAEEYSTLDHGLGKGGTLPTKTAAPSSDSEYGKLDQVHTHAHIHCVPVYMHMLIAVQLFFWYYSCLP